MTDSIPDKPMRQSKGKPEEAIHTDHVRQNGTIDDTVVETYYRRAQSICVAEGYLRITIDDDAVDIETRIPDEALKKLCWTPPNATQLPPIAPQGETPRTDAVIPPGEWRSPWEAKAWHGLIDTSRQLEREISDMTAARDRTVRLLDEEIEENTKLRGEIAEAIERIADLKSGVEEANQRWLAARSASEPKAEQEPVAWRFKAVRAGDGADMGWQYRDTPPALPDMYEPLYLSSRSAKTPPLDPTPAMVEAGAQRLVRWETGNEKWPDAWSKLDVRAARNDAERCWRSMWLEAEAAAQPTEKAPTEGGTVGGTASLTVLTETEERG